MPKKDDTKRTSDGKVHGPCGECAYYHGEETQSEHRTGRCHGAPPGALGWPVVTVTAAGCAVFTPAD